MSARTTGSEDQPGGFFYPFWPLKKGNKKCGCALRASPKRTARQSSPFPRSGPSQPLVFHILPVRSLEALISERS